MKLKHSFKIALNIILHSKLRSWLTILGIVIGIAAVVAIVSVSQGAEKTLSENLNTLNADILTISSGMSRAQGPASSFSGGGFPGEFGSSSTSNSASSSNSNKHTTKNLTSKDVVALKTVSNIEIVTGIISGSVSNATFLGKTARITIQGVDPAVWKEMDSSSTIASGRFLTQGDTNSIVLGGRVANSTFGNVEINQQILIGGISFKVVGILEQVGSSGMGGSSNDNKVFMPIDYAVMVLEGKQEKTYDSILVKIKDISLTNQTTSDMTERLMFSHSILDSKYQDFSIESPTAIQSTISSTLSSTSIFLTAIAIISLIVGAIGIMNTMFTSVLEKTREIGILKAIGAKDRDILAIFLLNAAIIGLIGGIFGIALGIFASNYVGLLTGSTTSAMRGPGGMGGMGMFLSSSYISPQLVIEIFLLSIAVGLVAGAIPAYRASRLEPVDALRYE